VNHLRLCVCSSCSVEMSDFSPAHD
jgi:hypothetical protein